MSASQPLGRSVRTVVGPEVTYRLTFLLVALLGVALLFSSAASAQNPTSLVTLATDQMPLNLSSNFGVPLGSAVNQVGDYAFIGQGGSALFLKRAGTSPAVRLLQFGDAVPNITGATVVDFANLGGLNSSAHLLFAVDYNVSPADGRLHRAIFLYNGTSYITIATSDQVAPGTGGLTFGPSILFGGLASSGGALNDHDDVVFLTNLQPFAPADTTSVQNTFYIAPAAGTPVRVLGFGDTLQGVTGQFVGDVSITPINALGQFLVNAEYGGAGNNLNYALYLVSTSGVTKVVATGDTKPSPATGTFTINAATTFALNNSGQAAFVDPGTPASQIEPGIWFYSSGSPLANIYTGPLPNSGASTSVQLNALSDLGEALASVSPGAGSSSIVRVHSSNDQVDTVASIGQTVNGATFSSLSNPSIDNTDRITFFAVFSSGTGIYQQTGTATPQAVVLRGQSAPLSGGGTLNLIGGTKALNNGSTFFPAAISGGAANYGQFLGVPGTLTTLMSTADPLPAGARVRLSQPSWTSGNDSNELFVGFVANLTGGQSAIFVKEIVSGVTTRVVSDGDVIPGFGGQTLIQRATSSGSKPYYMNGNGEIAFPGFLSGNSYAILFAEPFGGVSKVAAIGDTAPLSGSPTFTNVDFSSNTTSLSPVNDSGQVAFYGNASNGVNGIFLGFAGGGLSTVAFIGEAVPEGGATFTAFNGCTTCSLALNSGGLVAFGANKSNGSGIYTSFGGGTLEKVFASTDAPPWGSGTLISLEPISGFNDNGQVVAEPVFGGGVLLGSGGSAATAVAVDNTTIAGGTLATATILNTVGTLTSYATTANATIDDCGDVVFRSRLTGGSADSGYFGVAGTECSGGGSSGPLQALALEGQSVAGAGTLGTIFPSTLTSSFFSLGDNNSAVFSFTNSYTNSNNTQMIGQFLGIAGNVYKVMAPGDTILGTGGGTYASATTAASSTNSGGGTNIYEVMTTGGTAAQALVLAVEQGGTVPTTTTVASSQNPSGVNQYITFTATVTTNTQGFPDAGDFVGFFDNGVAIGLGVLDASGQATFSTSSLTAGTHTITAQYFANSGNNNDENFEGSISAPLAQVVSNATVTLLFSTQNPSAANTSVLFEAVVYSLYGNGTPTGTVTLSDSFNNTVTQVGQGTLTNGFAIFDSTPLAVGTHNITAQYSGDQNFPASTSAVVNQVAQQGTSGGLLSSATALASSVNPTVTGQSVTFTAVVDGQSGGTPTGTVNFLDGATVIGTRPLATSSNGTLNATFTTSSLFVGTHSITAVYSGDSNFLGSTSNVVNQVVTPAALTTIASRFAFAANQASNNVSAYTVDAVTGALTPVPGSPFPTGGIEPFSVTADPSGRFIYVANWGSNNIAVFAVDGTTGILSPLDGSPFTNTGGNEPASLAVDPAGRFLYAANQGGTNNVSVFAINNGNLTPVSGSPFASGGQFAYSVVAAPSGQFIYVANYASSTISVLSVNGTTGALTPVSGSPFAAGGTPGTVAVDPNGHYVYAANECSGCAGTVAAFSVNGTTGALTPVTGSPFTPGGTDAVAVSVDPSDRFVYVASYTSSNVSVFSVNATTGVLTQVSGSPFATGGTGPLSVSTDPTGHFVYVANYATANVSVFSVAGTTGFLTAVPGSPFTSAGANTWSVAALGTISNAGATLVSLAVQPGFAAIGVGGTQQFTAIGTYSDTSTRFLTTSATWSSSDGTAAMSNTPGSAGLATGVAAGNPYITATFGGVTSSSASLNITLALQSIVVTPTTSSIAVGNTQSFAATGIYSDGTMLDITPSVNWNSSATTFATIDDTGTATGIHAGQTMITAQLGDLISSPVTLTVTSATLQSIAVTPINPTTAQNMNEPFTATGTYSDNSVADLTSQVTWGTTAPNIASINGSGIANTSAELTGTATISATLGSVHNSTTLTVIRPPQQPQTQSFHLDFYGNNGIQNGVLGNLFEDYSVISNGTFQVASTALGTPNNLYLYRDPAFVAFDVPVFTNSNYFDFNLGATGTIYFPGDPYPFDDGTKTDPVQGLRLDASGNPLRFDTPSTLSGTAAVIRDFLNPSTPTAELTLVDSDAFNYVLLDDGTLLPRTSLDGQTPIQTVGGTWTFNGGPGDGTLYSGIYLITPVQAITSANSATFTVGTHGSFTVKTVGSPIYTSSLNESGTLPNNVSFVDNGDGTGTLSGTPAVGTVGIYPISITASNELDPDVTQNFTLTVVATSLTPTSIGLASSVNPSLSGQNVTFTATVTDSAEVAPTGTVNFIDSSADDASVGTATLSGGVATLNISSLSVGSHGISAQYLGDDTNFAASPFSNTVTQVVQAIHNPSVTILTSSLNPAAYGQSVVFTAIVYSPVGGTPTGTVSFTNNGQSLGSPVSLVTTSGQTTATFAVSLLPLGSNSIVAVYSGDSNYNTSTSVTVTQMINHGPTATAVTSSPNPSTGGQAVQFSAIVTSSTGETPTGTVTFLDSGESIGTGNLNVNGVATFNTSALSVGAHTITAQYPSGLIFNGSTSATLMQNVTVNSTATALISSLNPSPSTDFVQFSAIVTSSAGITPTGTVIFEDNTTDAQLASATLSANGVATFGTSTLSIGTHSITAQYLGNSSFGGSTSTALVQSVTINPTPTTTPTTIAISSNPNPSAVGQAVQITATVSSSTGVGTPTGHVTFLAAGAPITGGVVQLTSGSAVAAFTTSSLASGTNALTAQYSGDANFALSLSPVINQIVGSASGASVQITPIPTNVAPQATCPSGGYCEQFGATVQNGGTNPTVTWQVLSGPGSIDSTGDYTALPTVTQGLVTISATVGNSSASISFTLGPDALTTSQAPASVAPGAPLSVSVQLAGVPTTSTVPFILSCGSLPAATTCQFSNTSSTPAGCPMGVITSVTGACPNFVVTVITSGGSTSRLAPGPFLPGTPWTANPLYGLFAVMLSALALAGRRRVFVGGRGYACCVLVLLCLSVVFLTSCSVFPATTTVTAPAAVPLTPAGSYQVVVLATPPAGGGFVQTQLIVPVVVQ